MDNYSATKRVALIVDNPVRDLPGIVLLGRQLAADGHTVYLVPINLQAYELWPLAPDFVLLNYLRTSNERVANALREADIGYGFLDTEGGILSSLDSFAATMTADTRIREGAACFCCWGPRLAQHAVEKGWYRPDQVHVTGTPKLDYYADPWRAAALRSSDYAAPFSRNLILFNGIFALGNPRFMTPEQEVAMYVRYFGNDADVMRGVQIAQQEMMVRFVDVANRIAAKFPEATIVYRPHPFERLETYDDLLAPLPNLHLVRQGTVDGWILRAKVLVQSGCSTTIDAGLAGVPSLTPTWIAPPGEVQSIESVSIPCGSFDTLASIVDDVLGGRYARPVYVEENLRRVVADWFFRVDGKSHARVADVVRSASAAVTKKPNLGRLRDIAHGATASGVPTRRRARGLIAGLLGRSVHWSFRNFCETVPTFDWWLQSGKAFGCEDVERLVAALEEADDSGLCRQITARKATRGDYQFGYRAGRSVVLEAA